MLYTKGFIKAALALTAIASASSAMAVNATALLNTALLTANSITVTSLGAANYNSTSGALTIAEQTATTALATFAAADGFKVQTSYGPLSFTNFTVKNNGMLTGNLQGSGLFLSGVTFTGDLLQGSTLTNTASGLLAENFAPSASFSTYLSGIGLTASTITVLGGLLNSMTTPGLVAPVPEPSTYALMGLGLVGISLVARRRRQAA